MFLGPKIVWVHRYERMIWAIFECTKLPRNISTPKDYLQANTTLVDTLYKTDHCSRVSTYNIQYS